MLTRFLEVTLLLSAGFNGLHFVVQIPTLDIAAELVWNFLRCSFMAVDGVVMIYVFVRVTKVFRDQSFLYSKTTNGVSTIENTSSISRSANLILFACGVTRFPKNGSFH